MTIPEIKVDAAETKDEWVALGRSFGEELVDLAQRAAMACPPGPNRDRALRLMHAFIVFLAHYDTIAVASPAPDALPQETAHYGLTVVP